MKKLAIFTEGQTEQIFAERLLREIAGNQINITKRRASRGDEPRAGFIELEASAGNSRFRYYVLIYDCGCDTKVKSEIKDNYDKLKEAGFSNIIGMRDVFPIKRAHVTRLRKGLRADIKNAPIPVVFILGVMEIESWFLAEHTHFVRIDPCLNLKKVKRILRFDPSTYEVENRRQPSKDLDKVYRAVGLFYNKSKGVVHRTVRALDYERVYMELVNRLYDLNVLVQTLNSFFTQRVVVGSILPSA